MKPESVLFLLTWLSLGCYWVAVGRPWLGLMYAIPSVALAAIIVWWGSRGKD